MSDGKRLKEILDKKGIKVSQLARKTAINPQTLYSIIQKDRSIRFDFALRIANVLGIEPNEICSDTSFSEDSGEPLFPLELDNVLDNNRIKNYLTNKVYPLLLLFGVDKMSDIDEMLIYYYQLTDEARADVDKYIEERYILKKDAKRCQELKQIT